MSLFAKALKQTAYLEFTYEYLQQEAQFCVVTKASG